MDYLGEDGSHESNNPTFAERRESLLKLSRLFHFEERRMHHLPLSKTYCGNSEFDFPGKSDLKEEILRVQERKLDVD